MRCVIVTGVSRGLGAALARVLLERDAVVLGVGRSSAAGLEGERYRFAACDLADVAGIDAALAPAFGAIAGLAESPLSSTSEAFAVGSLGASELAVASPEDADATPKSMGRARRVVARSRRIMVNLTSM